MFFLSLKNFNGIIIVELYAKGSSLVEREVPAGVVPKLPAVDKNFGRSDTIEDNDAVVRQYGQHLGHDVLETASVPTNEDSIRTRECGDV